MIPLPWIFEFWKPLEKEGKPTPLPLWNGDEFLPKLHSHQRKAFLDQMIHPRKNLNICRSVELVRTSRVSTATLLMRKVRSTGARRISISPQCWTERSVDPMVSSNTTSPKTKMDTQIDGLEKVNSFKIRPCLGIKTFGTWFKTWWSPEKMMDLLRLSGDYLDVPRSQRYSCGKSQQKSPISSTSSGTKLLHSLKQTMAPENDVVGRRSLPFSMAYVSQANC